METIIDLRLQKKLYRMIISQLKLDGYHRVALELIRSLDISSDVGPSSELLDMLTEHDNKTSQQLQLASSISSPGVGLQFKKEVNSSDVCVIYEEKGSAPNTGECSCATFSKDGLLAAVGCQDGSIRVYDVPASLKVEKDTTTNTMLCKMMDMCAPVEAMAFHPDGQILVAGSSLGLSVYDLTSNIEPKTNIRHLEDPYQVNALQFHPSGMYLAVATMHPHFRMYDTKLWNCFTFADDTNQHTAPVTAVQYNHSGSLLATACKAGVVKIWDVVECVCLNSIEDNFVGAACTSLMFSSSDDYLLVGGMGSLSLLLDMTTVSHFFQRSPGSVMSRYIPHAPTIESQCGACFGADETSVAACTAVPGEVQLWHAQSVRFSTPFLNVGSLLLESIQVNVKFSNTQDVLSELTYYID
eukprot:gene11249-3296_t